MKSNDFLKKSFLLIAMLLLCNALVAQDKITFTWQSSHYCHGLILMSGEFEIRATNGEQFTIDWGDGSPVQTITGLGNTNICIGHNYEYSYGSGYDSCNVTIEATNTDCRFTYLDCHTHLADDAPSFQITRLTLEGCSDLTYLCCFNNSLQLSDLYAAHLIINEQGGKLFGTQYMQSSQPFAGGETIDFSVQRIFGGVETFFDVRKKAEPFYVQAIINVDYSINNGIITFITDGGYIVTMTNGAIIPHPSYPASVMVGIDLTSLGILDHPLPKIEIYPNPTSNIVYVQTESTTIPELKLYSLAGKLLQQIRSTEIDLSAYPAGIYLLSVDRKTVKIVKK